MKLSLISLTVLLVSPPASLQACETTGHSELTLSTVEGETGATDSVDVLVGEFDLANGEFVRIHLERGKIYRIEFASPSGTLRIRPRDRATEPVLPSPSRISPGRAGPRRWKSLPAPMASMSLSRPGPAGMAPVFGCIVKLNPQPGGSVSPAGRPKHPSGAPALSVPEGRRFRSGPVPSPPRLYFPVPHDDPFHRAAMKTQGHTRDVLFLAGARTGFGSFGGTLKDFTATDLGAIAAKAALERSGGPAIDHVVFGNALQTSTDAIYLARHVALRAGLPIETPAVTVNRLCGSGFESIIQGAQQILLDESRTVLAGGAESMSQAPHVVRGARWGLRLGPAAPFEDLLWESLKDPQCGFSMAETAENLADKYVIPRAEVDAYALLSQMRAKEAWAKDAFREEITPVPIPNRKTKQTDAWGMDEHMRPDTNAEGLARLAPYFKKDGVVTAGNASGICDGAAAVVLAGENAIPAGIKPLGRLVSWAVAGVEPRFMGIGPAPAARKALAKAGLTLDQMDLVEVNEAFAAQYVAVERELGLDRERTNVDGGAIAIGHPLAASGTRITLHLLLALRRRGKRFGLGSACIGGGQGAAVIVEAFGD